MRLSGFLNGHRLEESQLGLQDRDVPVAVSI
jgi:hypothetical protein